MEKRNMETAMKEEKDRITRRSSIILEILDIFDANMEKLFQKNNNMIGELNQILTEVQEDMKKILKLRDALNGLTEDNLTQ